MAGALVAAAAGSVPAATAGAGVVVAVVSDSGAAPLGLPAGKAGTLFCTGVDTVDGCAGGALKATGAGVAVLTAGGVTELELTSVTRRLAALSRVAAVGAVAGTAPGAATGAP